MRYLRLISLALPALVMGAVQASAMETIQLMLKDHRFTPDQVSVPAGERFRIEVTNHDGTPAEFESSDLRVEKIVTPGGKISVFAGPLKPGKYAFADEYHSDQAKGTLTAIAKE